MTHVLEQAIVELAGNHTSLDAWCAWDGLSCVCGTAALAERMLTEGLLPAAVPAFCLLAPDFAGSPAELVLVANQLVPE